MKFRRPILSVLLILIASAAAADSISEAKNHIPWDQYDTYNVSGFKRFGPANRAIDFNNIDYPLLNAAIFYETNRRRAGYGLFPYKHSDALEKAAFMHSIDMFRDGFFAHENYGDARKREPTDRSAIFGGPGAGENIATCFGIQYEAGTMVSDISAIPPHTYNSFAEALVEGWMQSPGHKANILDEGGWGYEYLGCGAFYNTGDAWHMFHATQNFSYSDEGARSAGGGSAGSGGSGGRSGNNSNPGGSTRSVLESYSLEQGNLLVNRGGSSWEQLDSSGNALYSYIEDDRDGDYIYLYDNRRDLWLAIPVYGGSLYYKYGSGGSWEFWLITGKQE